MKKISLKYLMRKKKKLKKLLKVRKKKETETELTKIS